MFSESTDFARSYAVGDHPLHLGVHELRRLLRDLAPMLDLAAEEELLLVVADEDRTDRVGQSPTA
jgi:hypothetical protein